MRSRPNHRRPGKFRFVTVVLSVLGFLTLTATGTAQTKTGLRGLLSTAATRLSGDLKASFLFGPKFPLVDHSVQFTDTSTGSPTSWLWDFGDGGKSTARHPLHCYAAPGFKKVTLTVTSAQGSKTSSRTLTVLSETAVASFVFSPTTPGPGQTVQFADTTVGTTTAWAWDFGDGSTGSGKNPSHVYLRAGTYTVAMTVTAETGPLTAKRTIVVTTASVLQAAFNYSPAAPQVDQSVQFLDASSGSPTAWLWSFGDGGTSSLQNPLHTYMSAGTKTVTLKVTAGSNSTTASRTIQVASNALTAAFTYSPVAPAPGQAVQFTDTSTGSPSSWAWDFNDGSTSASRNPSHAFGAAGTYNVSLTASNGTLSQTTRRTVVVALDDGSPRYYWVSPTGTAPWANARSGSPLSGAACCSLATANANAGAGDTVVLRGGTYYVNSQRIEPAHSGTKEARITYAAHTGETPLFSRIDDGTLNRNNHAVRIVGQSYIVVDGIAGRSLSRWIYISTGACFNEIRNCRFSTVTYDCAIRIWDYARAASTDNWLHHNVFERVGFVGTDGQDMLSLLQIDCDGTASTRTSSHNTIENNIFRYGGHDCGETYSKYNVIRNNFYHNEGWMQAPTLSACGYGPDANGLYGNRNIQICGDRTNGGMYNLIEGNRFGASGAPADDDGGDALCVTAPANIVRYNEILNGQNNGLLLKIAVNGRADNNRIYNNTIVWNGRYRNVGLQWQGYGIRYYPNQVPPVGNVIKNNLLFGNSGGDVDHRIWTSPPSDTTRDNTWESNWVQADGDPLFVDPTHSDLTSPTLPNLALQGQSGATNRGTHLTLAKGSGSSSLTIIMDDALFFQDGTWGSALTYGITQFPDWIAVGTVDNIVQIKSINYATNTVTLASPVSWSDRAKIWLYSDSTGRRVLNGTAPDLGAHEIDQR